MSHLLSSRNLVYGINRRISHLSIRSVLISPLSMGSKSDMVLALGCLPRGALVSSRSNPQLMQPPTLHKAPCARLAKPSRGLFLRVSLRGIDCRRGGYDCNPSLIYWCQTRKLIHNSSLGKRSSLRAPAPFHKRAQKLHPSFLASGYPPLYWKRVRFVALVNHVCSQ